MINDSSGGVQLHCLITAWASVENVGLCCAVSARCGNRNRMYRIPPI